MKLNRRSMLGTSLAVAGSQVVLDNPLALLLQNILRGSVRDAHAAELGLKPGNFLYIQLAGAPARWTLTPLAPVKDDLSSMVRNIMVATRFTGTSFYDDMEYATKPLEGLEMPWLWGFEVAQSPKSGGGVRPMAGLLKNMCMIRGIQTIGAHAPAQMLRFHPLGVRGTFGAVVSDASEAPIPAINMEAHQFDHVSKKGTTAIDLISGGNMLAQLLNGFLADSDRFYANHKQSVQALVEKSINALEDWSETKVPASLSSAESLRSARRMIERGFGDLDSEFFGRVEKYQSLIDRTIHGDNENERLEYLNINDRPIGIAPELRNNTNYKDYRIQRDFEVCKNPDIRDIINRDASLRFGRANVRRMAAHFAVTEYILVNQLSSSITISPPHMSGLTIRNETDQAFDIPHDEHRVGRFGSLLCNTFFNLALGSCLLELFDRIKDANLFDDLVVDCSGEFGRKPREVGSGSDHGGRSLDVALWSGRLGEKPQVIGDIVKNSEEVSSDQYRIKYSGTWGVGARNLGSEYGSVGKLHMGHLASTQAHLLNVPSPNRSSRSLLKPEGDKLVPILPTGRIVDEE